MHVSMIYSNKYALSHETANNERHSGRMTGCDEMAKTAIVTLPSRAIFLSFPFSLSVSFPISFFLRSTPTTSYLDSSRVSSAFIFFFFVPTPFCSRSRSILYRFVGVRKDIACIYFNGISAAKRTRSASKIVIESGKFHLFNCKEDHNVK